MGIYPNIAITTQAVPQLAFQNGNKAEDEVELNSQLSEELSQLRAKLDAEYQRDY